MEINLKNLISLILWGKILTIEIIELSLDLILLESYRPKRKKKKYYKNMEFFLKTLKDQIFSKFALFFFQILEKLC